MTNEEIIRGAYAAGKRRITCPVCNGGESHEEDTMSLRLGEFDWFVRGHCFRATCGAAVVDAVVKAPFTAPPAFEPRPLRAPYRLVLPTDAWGTDWCERMGQDPFFGDTRGANERGMRVLLENPDTCVWRLRALDGTLTGHITRTRDKKISTYKDLDRALYYWNSVHALYGNWFLFEDPMSAALCQFGAVALLGTSIPQGLIADFKARGARSVLVCLDPGAEDAALKVYERLVAAGVPAVFVPMAKDFKDMTVAERRELEEVYA